MLTGYDKTLPVAGAAGVGASAYQDWLTLPGNAGRSKADFLASLIDVGAVSAGDLAAALANYLPNTASGLLALFDGLPPLPADPALYPAAGGLFRSGDANGYGIVRIMPTGI
ncbi:hypothetical protein [Methylobacterium sp. WL6]|uniref:hypothetical protein n=1 Tax=Methylobacterium sp. WL6 TaxID=2603901 RepID=UPI0011C86CBB|nr:hypothetical protein [Methylobacterium sp. WL6]TXN67267.1 hypothetical protein FV230_14490 [Methylobacterium sp. WL6]